MVRHQHVSTDAACALKRCVLHSTQSLALVFLASAAPLPIIAALDDVLWDSDDFGTRDSLQARPSASR